MDLKECRERIDHLDQNIIKLLEQRFDIVNDVAAYKLQRGMPVLDEKREQEKLEALEQLCSEKKRQYIAEILNKIMEQSRCYQHEMFDAVKITRCGLLGRTLGHSHSPRIHQLLGGYRYELLEREPGELEAFFADPSWQGINVTIPYKREVMHYCDRLSETARRCNSVNTIVRSAEEPGTQTEAGRKALVNFGVRMETDRKESAGSGTQTEAGRNTSAGTARGQTGSGHWITIGHNTDYDGFRYMVESAGIEIHGCKALVLGSGGVSGTVVQALQDLGADPVVIISRSGENNYDNLQRHADAGIIVNCTPVGMFPKAGQAPVDLRDFPNCRAVYDLIYNPLRTRLMLDAEALGIPAFGGLPMLVAQAARAAELFGCKPVRKTEDVYQIMVHDLENIVLIGMPGVGKTTVGRLLAEQMDRPFRDLDQEIEKRTGISPAEIIRTDGEDRFRQIETEALEDAAAVGGQVIAAGGGIVERSENRDLILQNGRAIWLRRPVSDLPLQGRPISQREGLDELLKRREPAYRAWSEFEVSFGDAGEAVRRILAGLQEDKR